MRGPPDECTKSNCQRAQILRRNHLSCHKFLTKSTCSLNVAALSIAIGLTPAISQFNYALNGDSDVGLSYFPVMSLCTKSEDRQTHLLYSREGLNAVMDEDSTWRCLKTRLSRIKLGNSKTKWKYENFAPILCQ